MTTPLIHTRPTSETDADAARLPEPLPDARPSLPGVSHAKIWLACGIFLLVVGLYALSSPGRIDIIDGEARFDVSYNWLLTGRPVIRDNWIGPLMGLAGRDGLRYSYYGAPASLLAMPLVWLGLHFGSPAVPLSQFLFSLTSTIFGAAVAPVLFLFYLELGVTMRRAIAWTMVSSFATLLWPVSNSTFDNAQHAFFALAALYFAFLSARRKSRTIAMIGGIFAGVLILYQEYFLLIVPAIALATLDRGLADMESLTTESVVPRVASSPKRVLQEAWYLIRTAYDRSGDTRASCVRYCLFIAAASLGIVLALGYNHLRFDSWLDDGKFRFAAFRNHPLLGNPVAGLLTLLCSPGKGVFLYSPTLILGILGIARLRRRRAALAGAIATSSLLLVLFISCFIFAGGDWCWGPRYLTPLLPLWALAFPLIGDFRQKRPLVLAIVILGLLVQVLALSIDNQRFFFEKGFNDFFWAEDSWVYFKHSALLARVGETFSLSQGVPTTARFFNSVPIPNWTTYAPLGTPANVPRSLAPLWIRNFQVYFLPRPWPLWMSSLPSDLRPLDLRSWLAGFLGVSLLGFGLIFRGLQNRENL